MRLLHTSELVFVEFFDTFIPPYAILSHRWGSPQEEVAYKDFVKGRKKDTFGYHKIIGFCQLAQSNGFDYAWIDTCCIDKSSSAELSEAINSMFRWYRNAQVCYVYLSDIHDRQDAPGLLHSEENSRKSVCKSIWFKRGWTLQELIAPRNLEFYDLGWLLLGTRDELKTHIASITGIDERVLTGEAKLADYSIAQKLSWAAERTTSRVEDQAYCLLGLMGVSMPLLYGEGHEAFYRLQEVLLTKTKDDSLFAWSVSPIPRMFSDTVWPSMLAHSPKAFSGSGNIHLGFNTRRINYEASNGSMVVNIHRSFDPHTIDKILKDVRPTDQNHHGRSVKKLILPLGCYRELTPAESSSGTREKTALTLHLHLGPKTGGWRCGGVYESGLVKDVEKQHYSAYANDYVKLYIQHDWSSGSGSSLLPKDSSPSILQPQTTHEDDQNGGPKRRPANAESLRKTFQSMSNGKTKKSLDEASADDPA